MSGQNPRNRKDWDAAKIGGKEMKLGKSEEKHLISWLLFFGSHCSKYFNASKINVVGSYYLMSVVLLSKTQGSKSALRNSLIIKWYIGENIKKKIMSRLIYHI